MPVPSGTGTLPRAAARAVPVPSGTGTLPGTLPRVGARGLARQSGERRRMQQRHVGIPARHEDGDERRRCDQDGVSTPRSRPRLRVPGWSPAQEVVAEDEERPRRSPARRRRRAGRRAPRGEGGAPAWGRPARRGAVRRSRRRLDRRDGASARARRSGRSRLAGIAHTDDARPRARSPRPGRTAP